MTTRWHSRLWFSISIPTFFNRVEILVDRQSISQSRRNWRHTPPQTRLTKTHTIFFPASQCRIRSRIHHSPDKLWPSWCAGSFSQVQLYNGRTPLEWCALKCCHDPVFDRAANFLKSAARRLPLMDGGLYSFCSRWLSVCLRSLALSAASFASMTSSQKEMVPSHASSLLTMAEIKNTRPQHCGAQPGYHTADVYSTE